MPAPRRAVPVSGVRAAAASGAASGGSNRSHGWFPPQLVLLVALGLCILASLQIANRIHPQDASKLGGGRASRFITAVDTADDGSTGESSTGSTGGTHSHWRAAMQEAGHRKGSKKAEGGSMISGRKASGAAASSATTLHAQAQGKDQQQGQQQGAGGLGLAPGVKPWFEDYVSTETVRGVRRMAYPIWWAAPFRSGSGGCSCSCCACVQYMGVAQAVQMGLQKCVIVQVSTALRQPRCHPVPLLHHRPPTPLLLLVCRLWLRGPELHAAPAGGRPAAPRRPLHLPLGWGRERGEKSGSVSVHRRGDGAQVPCLCCPGDNVCVCIPMPMLVPLPVLAWPPGCGARRGRAAGGRAGGQGAPPGAQVH